MNVRQAIVEERNSKEPKFIHVNFNQDDSCFSCATENGFQIYNTYPLCLKLTKIFQPESSADGGAGLGMTCMLHRTNYIAIVGGGKAPKFPLNKVIIWDDLKNSCSKTLNFMSSVRNVFLSRTHIAVVLDSSIEFFLFNKGTQHLCQALETYPRGPVDFRVSSNATNGALGENSLRGILAYANPKHEGQINIADLTQLKENDQDPDGTKILPTTVIKGHKNPLALIKINHQGTMVATCSVQGTLIRVFSTQNGSLLREFRRGIESAQIYDMSFSPEGTRLAVVSSKQTLHVFQVSEDTQLNSNTASRKKSIRSLRRMVPNSLQGNYLNSTWSICKFRLSNPMLRRKDLDPEFAKDRCVIGWCKDNTEYTDEDSLVLIWPKHGIWEKYVIIEKENEESHNSTVDKIQWEILRESWREL